MTRQTPLYDIMTRIDHDSGHRSDCLVPLDDDWKERMRALNQNAEIGNKAPPSTDDE